jgi:hypothetical protein
MNTHLGERCDEIVALIDRTLADATFAPVPMVTIGVVAEGRSQAESQDRTAGSRT